MARRIFYIQSPQSTPDLLTTDSVQWAHTPLSYYSKDPSPTSFPPAPFNALKSSSIVLQQAMSGISQSPAFS